jgi:2-succinyl-5-enolpyruvyl-6-hydroxy-3-cyclohexene-1-carboxylate synthase
VSFDPDWAWRDPGREVDYIVAGRLDFETVEALVPAAVPAQAAVPVPAAGPAQGSGPWLALWDEVEGASQAAIDEVLSATSEINEPGVARKLFDWLPAGSTILASSSMPIRDLEWFGRPRHDPPEVLANRGANGIDGVVSTLLGVAAARGLTYGLVGDLAVLHDASALVRPSTGAPPTPAVVVVLDNRGGGIFSFLPQARDLSLEEFEQLFGTPQVPSVADLTAACGYPTSTITSAGEFEAAIEEATAAATRSHGPVFVIARTDRAANLAVHEAISAAVASRVERR